MTAPSRSAACGPRPASLKWPCRKNSEWAGWEKHYRLALQAIDISAVSRPTPTAAQATAKSPSRTASGKKLGLATAFRRPPRSLRAKAMFFAAADKAYIELYGRSYIEFDPGA